MIKRCQPHAEKTGHSLAHKGTRHGEMPQRGMPPAKWENITLMELVPYYMLGKPHTGPDGTTSAPASIQPTPPGSMPVLTSGQKSGNMD